MHYIEPADRTQFVFLNKLDDMVGQDNIVRLLDYLVDSIIEANPKNFIYKGSSSFGRKAYSPNLFMKLYIYGYFNRINSSRKLEVEAKRNIELIWLLGSLQPDFKTISDYRKDNKENIFLFINRFKEFLKSEGYIEGKVVSLDGTKVRANAGKSINLDLINRDLTNLEGEIKNYLSILDQNDADDESSENNKGDFIRKINDLEQEVEKLKKEKEFLLSNGIKRYSPTDTDSRKMKGREGSHYCYNVQTLVDQKHKMLIAATATNDENDKNQLQPNVEILSNEGMDTEILLADTGYHKTEAIKEVEKNGIECFIPINHNQSTDPESIKEIGILYDEENDQYICSEGAKLILTNRKKNHQKRGASMVGYQCLDCKQCPKKSICCPTEKKGKIKWRHLDGKWREEYEKKMQTPEAEFWVKKRKELSEHPFGIIKYWMGKISIKVRGLSKVQTDINIYHIAYNFVRLTNIRSFSVLKNQITNHDWKIA